VYLKSEVFWFGLKQAIMHTTATTQGKYPSNIARQGKQVQYGKENT
jgi:hypothetical protein